MEEHKEDKTEKIMTEMEPMNIIATITNKTVEFQSEVFGIALAKWGYKKEDVEKALKELSEYKRTGLEPGKIVILKERAKEKKLIKKEFRGSEYYICPFCKEPVWNASSRFCPTCGQRLEDNEFIRKHMKSNEIFEFDFTGIQSFNCPCGRHYVNTASESDDGLIPRKQMMTE